MFWTSITQQTSFLLASVKKILQIYLKEWGFHGWNASWSLQGINRRIDSLD